MDIAKALLLYALYMQQLPRNFNVQLLESHSIERAVELIVKRVKSFVLSHEDEASSLDGIECLSLLSLIQLNDGALSKAWMTFRRALDTCRLNGLHNSFSLSARDSSIGDMALRRRLWLSTVCGDCYCSLLLGLEPGIGIPPFGPDDETWNDLFADDDANIQRRICLIVARIAQRNTVGLHKDYNYLQEIDEALSRLQNSIPPSWWRAPSFREDRSLDSAKEPNRLICQLWFFQARIFAHMPVAFGDSSDISWKSLERCLEASRITLQRYLGVQHARDHLSRCRIVDQSAFLAAVVLILAQVQRKLHKMYSTASRYDSDRALLEQVIDSFEGVGKLCHREHVARQSFTILSTMLEIATSDSNDPFLIASTSFGPKSPLTLEKSFGTMKSDMEDIIEASIQPVLSIESPASHLIKMLFITKQSVSEAPKQTQDQQLARGRTELTLGDFIDPTILQ